MNIFVLGKRYNMDIDSVLAHHGRSFHLPLELSRRGHDIRAVFLDYRTHEAFQYSPEEQFSIVVTPFRRGWLPAFNSYFRTVSKELDKGTPDIVMAGGDALNVVIGHLLAKRIKKPLVLDLKDDYSSFAMTRRLPFLKLLYRKTVTSADVVITVSSAFAASWSNQGCRSLYVLENAVSSDFDSVPAKEESRRRLGLPTDRFLLGTAGSLRKRRNVDTLVQGCAGFLRTHPEAMLVLAGARSRGDVEVPHDARHQVIDLGQIAPSEIPKLFSALDLGLIMNAPNDFGQHCYPQKFKEMVACGLPVAASKVGVFDNSSQVAQEVAFVFHPDQPDELASHLDAAYENRARLTPPNVHLDTWSGQASKLDSFIKVLC